jgi:IS5 family transposase
LFEPSAEVIRKGKASKLTEFGKLVKLQEAENQIIVDYEVFARRPSDMDLLIPAIDVHQAKLGRVPRLPSWRESSPGGVHSMYNGKLTAN